MKIKLFILFLFYTFLFSSCLPKVKREECKLKHPDYLKNAVIYEVNIRQYTIEGTFSAFEKHLPRLRNLGVDVLWLMPIHSISEKKRKGMLGSYYAVQDYKAVNPEFGTKEDFKLLVDKAHDMGFKIILDWAASHTGWDNAWIEEHPEWYARNDKGELIAPYDWTDVAKLNYRNEDLRKAMIDALLYWVREFDIDGFRCDMASELPTDFWNEARKELDSIKAVFMLAEAEDPALLQEAFDMDYAWKAMHIMNDIAKKEKNANAIYDYIKKAENYACDGALKMNFITNHDENSWNGTEFERYGNGVGAFALLSYMMNGMPMIYTGQEQGMDKRLAFFEKDTVPNWERNEIFNFYKKLNSLKHNHPALLAGKEGGELRRIKCSREKEILILSRKKGGREIIALFNFSDQTINFSVDKREKAPVGYTNYFLDVKTDLIPEHLAAWEYVVLVD